MKHKPYPEIVSGDSGWSIFEDEDRPRTNNQSKQMYVPITGACSFCGINHNRMIRRHELGHVKWSPKTMGRLKEGELEIAVELLEEVRINSLLASHSLPINELLICKAEAERMFQKVIYEGSVGDIIKLLLSVAFHGHKLNSIYQSRIELTSAEYIIFEDIYSEIKRRGELTYGRELEIDWAIAKVLYFVGAVLKRKRGYYIEKKISYRKVRMYSPALSKILLEYTEKPEPSNVLRSAEQAKKLEELRKAAENETGYDQHHAENEIRSQLETELNFQDVLAKNERDMYDELNRQGKMTYTTEEDYNGAWYDYILHKPDLSVNLQGRIKQGREYRPMDYGINPHYINRYCIDKKIFKQKQKVYGGTVLIDASGSMNFSGKDILEIMKQVPAVTIAMYNYKGYGTDKGDIRIIAANGKRVEETYLEKYSGGGNGIDGPALKWLGTQKPKRIWVSDMFVFGRNNRSSLNLLQHCKQIMKQNGIIRLADLDEVKRFALDLNKLE